LLEILLHKPEWAARLPWNLIDPELIESSALAAIADAIEHGELPSGGFGLMLEFFRGSPHEALIAEVVGGMADEIDLGALETVFNDAIAHLRQWQFRWKSSA
jgi:DNA primase